MVVPLHARRSFAAVTVLTALPWLWFVVRDGLGSVSDVLAIVLPIIVGLGFAVAVAVAVRRRQWRWLLPGFSALAVGVVAVLGPWLPADPGAVAPGLATTVAGANVTSRPSVAGELLALSPDVLVISEMPSRLEPALAGTYPFVERVSGGPQLSVFSKLPVRLLESREADLPGLRVEVAGPAGPFVLYALHVPRPWFTNNGDYQSTVAEHHRIMRALAARIAAETVPVVVAGDLNSPDRGRDYREMLRDGGLVDAMRDQWSSYTSVGMWSPLLLRIDHILVSDGWCGDDARTFDLPRSDHVGVVAAVGPCTGAAR